MTSSLRLSLWTPYALLVISLLAFGVHLPTRIVRYHAPKAVTPKDLSALKFNYPVPAPRRSVGYLAAR